MNITKPTYAAAQNAYQTILELHRAHPEDEGLLPALHHAEELLKALHAERRARL